MSRSRDREVIEGHMVEFRRTRDGYIASVSSLSIYEEGKTKDEAREKITAKLMVSSVPFQPTVLRLPTVRSTVPTEGRMSPRKRLAH